MHENQGVFRYLLNVVMNIVELFVKYGIMLILGEKISVELIGKYLSKRIILCTKLIGVYYNEKIKNNFYFYNFIVDYTLLFNFISTDIFS